MVSLSRKMFHYKMYNITYVMEPFQLHPEFEGFLSRSERLETIHVSGNVSSASKDECISLYMLLYSHVT